MKYTDNRVNLHVESKYTVYCIYLVDKSNMYPLYYGSTNSTVEGRYLKDRHFKKKYLYSKVHFLHKLYKIKGPIKTEMIPIKSDFKGEKSARNYEAKKIKEEGKEFLLINTEMNDYSWKVKNNIVVFNKPNMEKSFNNKLGVELKRI